MLATIYVFLGAVNKTAENRQNYYCETAEKTDNIEYLNKFCANTCDINGKDIYLLEGR